MISAYYQFTIIADKREILINLEVDYDRKTQRPWDFDSPGKKHNVKWNSVFNI